MGKLAPHVSCGDKIFIVSRKCKLKTRTHMGKLAPTWENLQPHGKKCTHVSLWRQDFILSGKCKLKTRTHMGKLAARFGDGAQRTRFQKADQTAGKSCRNGSVNCKSRG